MRIKEKDISYFLVVIAFLVMAFSLFDYSHHFSAEAGEGGCSPPSPYAFQYTANEVSAGPDKTRSAKLIQPAGKEFSFCYLSGVDFENIDETDNERDHCVVDIRTIEQEEWWAVSAKAEGGDDNSATCRGQCFYRE